MRRLLLISSLICAAIPAQAHTLTATVYDPWYSGRTTACGNSYSHWGVSVAHPWLPCGTRVTISHRGRTITAPVRDRCDCDLDLSAGAAAALGVPTDGTGTVRISY